MAKLLVSVRSAAEAQIAHAAGADLIDVKEPSRGSLGAADSSTINEVARQIGGQVPLSVALGELLECRALPDALPGAVRYAKFGLSGCAGRAEWTTLWRDATARLPAGVQGVAVAYADWQIALSPDPWRVVAHAEASGCCALLVDTFDKSRGSLVDHLGLELVGQLISASRQRGLLSVVAGGLGLAEIAQVLPLAPDYIAVRGAACVGGRTGRIDAKRARRLAALVHATPVESATRSD